MKRFLISGILVLTILCVKAQDAAEKINQANEALTAKDYKKAFELYDDAIKNIGDVQVDESINFNVGYAAYKAKNYPAALVYFDKAIASEVRADKCWEYKAIIHNKLKHYSLAVEYFEKAILLTDEDKDNLIFNTGISAYKGEDYVKAIEMFEKAIDLNHRSETAQYYKAIAFKKQGKEAEYKQALTEGVEKFPEDKKLKTVLAKEYVQEGNEFYQKGVAIINAANREVSNGDMKTTSDIYSLELGKAKNRFKKAVDILEKAKKLDATNENIVKLLDACNENLSI